MVTECTCAPRGLRGVRSLRKLIFYDANKQKEPQNKLIYLLKHRPNRRISEFVARELSFAIHGELAAGGSSEELGNAVLVHLPRGRRSRTLYGFDQSELICRAVSKQMGIDCADAIGRAKGGREQKKLTGSKRFGNVKGRFYLKKEVDLSGKTVLLIDDIVTTGASMSGCVKLLQKTGAKEILGFCIAQDHPKQKKRGER